MGGELMRTLKRILVLLVVCLTITMVIPTQFNYSVLTVEAHPGKTDRNGGHKDKKNKSGLGSYHYHCGGHPAHLHDNGVCPYAGSTNPNSSSTSSSTTNTASGATAASSTSSNNAQPAADNTAMVAATVKISDTSYDNVAFNASYYANNHTDVYELYGDNAKALYEHFISSGIKEGRQASSQFNISIYKANNQDLAETFGDDLIKYYNHFIESGYNENRVSK